MPLFRRFAAKIASIACLLLIAVPAAAEHHAETDEAAHTFVLVHGAWVGGWVWNDVKDRLEAAGHEVYAPTFTGLAERSHLLDSEVTRSTHVADITSLIEFHQLDGIVLVGHSYGGLVISEVVEALPEGTIRSIVFLDALMPPLSLAQADDDLPPFLQPVDDAIAPLPIEMFGYDEETVKVFTRPRTPMPAAALFEPALEVPNLDTIPKKTFVLATRSIMPEIAASYETARADPSWTIREIDTLHDTMLTEPDETVRLLLEAAE